MSTPMEAQNKRLLLERVTSGILLESANIRIIKFAHKSFCRQAVRTNDSLPLKILSNFCNGSSIPQQLILGISTLQNACLTNFPSCPTSVNPGKSYIDPLQLRNLPGLTIGPQVSVGIIFSYCVTASLSKSFASFFVRQKIEDICGVLFMFSSSLSQ